MTGLCELLGGLTLDLCPPAPGGLVSGVLEPVLDLGGPTRVVSAFEQLGHTFTVPNGCGWLCQAQGPRAANLTEARAEAFRWERRTPARRSALMAAGAVVGWLWVVEAQGEPKRSRGWPEGVRSPVHRR